MKQSFSLWLILSAFLIFVSSCKKVVGTGPLVLETRAVSGFDGIDLSMDATVHITQDSVYSVTVEAQDNIMNEIQTELNGSILKIKHTNSVLIKAKPITVTVHMPTLKSLEVSGSGVIDGQNNFTSQQVDMEVSGSGKITLPGLTCNMINTEISGSGEIEIKSGSAWNLTSEISGSGDLYTQYLLSQNASCQTSGSGTTKVYVQQKLSVDISGSGCVYYRGTPTVTTKISGSGKVQHID